MLRQSLALGLAQGGARASPAHRVNSAIRRASSANSAGGGGGGGGKALLGLGVTGMAVVGGTVGYAGVDKDFRRTVEDTIPGSNTIFSMVHGELEPEKPLAPKKKPALPPTTATPPSKLRPIVVPSTETKLLDTSDKEALAKKTPPAPPLEKPAFMKEKKAEEEKKPEKKEEKPKEEKKEAPKKEKKAEDQPKKVEAVAAATGTAAATTAAVVATKDEPKEDPKPKVEEKEEKKSTKKPFVDEDDDAVSISAGKDLHKKILAVREEMEEQMRAQLKRQSEAHTDHITDALDVQKRELTRKHVRELDELLEKAQLAYRNEVAGIVGHLKGLQAALQHRSTMDAAALEAQELWLACSALQLAVDSHDNDKPVRNLNREIAAVRSVLSEHNNDPFVSTVLSSIPQIASCRGIATQESIKSRFVKVEEMAKRTAMIGDDGGSLFRYFLSYVQSKLIMEPSSIKELPDKATATDVDALNTFELVWLARGSLDRGDLEQAVKYMTLLRGEPKNVASDWVKEARLLLETKQATRALMAHAAAVGVEALPVKRKH